VESSSLTLSSEVQIPENLKMGSLSKESDPSTQDFALGGYPFSCKDAFDLFVRDQSISDQTKVFLLASGQSSCSDYIASKTGCMVSSKSFSELVEKDKEELSFRSNLEEGSLSPSGLRRSVSEDDFDFVVSFTGFGLYKNTKSLLRQCFNLLRCGGCLYLEEFCSFKETYRIGVVEDLIQLRSIRTIESFKAKVQKVGFVVEKMIDSTDQWSSYCRKSLHSIITEFESLRRSIGTDSAAKLRARYRKLNLLFQSSCIGGFRLVCRKPLVIKINPLLSDRTFDSRGYRRRAIPVCFRTLSSDTMILLLERRSYGWTIPGGGVDQGEESKDSAEREAYEEVGVRGTIVNKLGAYDEHHGKKTSDAYLFEVSEVLTDYPEKDRKRRWFSIPEAMKLLQENKTLLSILQEAERQLQNRN